MELAVTDLTLYWFMFPVSVLVATTAMLSGIGGAAYFVPIFWIIFPLLGPEYVIGDAQVIATALFTEVFGFASGFVGYFRRKLIDFKVGRAFAIVSVPAAIAGAAVLIAGVIPGVYLQILYGTMMLPIAWILYSGHELPSYPSQEPAANSSGVRRFFSMPVRQGVPHRTVDNTNTHYEYTFHRPRWGMLPLGFGGFLTGLVGVGIGEVTIPLFVRRYRIPVAVAAATSILVVTVTVASASFAQFVALINEGGVGAIPWELIMYTVPGVIIGGQIGPRLQGLIPVRVVERTIAALFVLIGTAFLILGARTLGAA